MVGKVVCFKVLLDKKEMTISEVVLQRFGGGEVGGGRSMPNYLRVVDSKRLHDSMFSK